MSQDCGRQPIIAFGIILTAFFPPLAAILSFDVAVGGARPPLFKKSFRQTRARVRASYGGRRYMRYILSDCFGDRVRGQEREMEYVMPRRRRATATPLSGNEGGGQRSARGR